MFSPVDSGGLRRTPFSGLQSTLFYFIPADSSGLRRNHHVTICDISGVQSSPLESSQVRWSPVKSAGVQSSPLDSGESSGFRRRRWGSVKYCREGVDKHSGSIKIPPRGCKMKCKKRSLKSWSVWHG